MIYFKTVNIQNFLSFYGDPVQIDLCSYKITAIKGNNGVGKSSILDAIYFALYGKSFRGVKLQNMVNSKAKKGCMIELTLDISGKEYIIKRGLAPNIFEIYINGTLKDISADVKTYQKNFITDILKIDEKTFRQLVVIGSSSYIPFLELSTGDRRVVIEQILRLDIFAKMNAIVNDKLNICCEKLVKAENDKRVAEEKYNLAYKMYSEDINEYKKQCLAIKASNEELKEKYLKLPDVSIEIQQIRDSQKDIQNKISDIEKNKAKNNSELTTIKKYVDYFEKNKVCPLCGQKPTSNFLDDKVKNSNVLKENIENFDKEIAELKESYNTFDTKLNSLLKTVEEKNNILTQIEYNKKQMKKYIDIVKNKKEVNNLDELKSDIEKYEKQYNSISKINTSLSYVKNILKDDGVKKVIINRYLQKLNEAIRHYLDIINMPIEFNLNNKFEETIVSNFNTEKDYQLENFSEGEKLRINISIMFALREFAKMYNSISTNLIFLDEFDNGVLDSEGLANMQDIILSLENTNIFIISHNVENFETLATNVLSLKKINGITEIN